MNLEPPPGKHLLPTPPTVDDDLPDPTLTMGSGGSGPSALGYADDDFNYGGMGDEGDAFDSLEAASTPSAAGPDRVRVRAATRRNVSRACEQCRTRKSKCSGESPACSLCVRLGKDCVYSTIADGRLTDRTAKRRIEMLQDRVNALEKALADALVVNARAGQSKEAALDQTTGSSSIPNAPLPAPTIPPPASREYFDVDSDDPEWQPFGTGRLVLAPTGNLHLYPAATFYSPAHLVPDWQKALDALVSHPPNRRGYLAPYLPFPLDPAHHARLIDLCFAHLLSFGVNSFQDRFMQEMEADPMARGIYFSPMCHLAVLSVGWRYMKDPSVLSLYYTDDAVAERGHAFAYKSLQMMADEVADPRISTIWGVFTLSQYHTGILKDSIGTTLYSTALTLTQDLRLHRQCDFQLAEIGMAVDGALDVARRDAYGSILNLSAWHSSYYSQDPLPLREHADQRLPLIRTDLEGPDRDNSEMFHYHVEMSDYGLQALHCNHTMRAPLAHRVARVKVIAERMFSWREQLPDNLQWPPRIRPTAGNTLHPSIVTTHGMYATYVIILFRPYILELGERSGIHEMAIQACLGAAADIVTQSRYLSATVGVTKTPFSWQHILYVCGSMLVLQASGLPSVSEAERARAVVDLAYVQKALDEISEVWPAASHTCSSLRQLLMVTE